MIFRDFYEDMWKNMRRKDKRGGSDVQQQYPFTIPSEELEVVMIQRD